MGSNGADELMVSGVDKADCSQTTVEIKIKTLDSHTYTMRVDKCVPVPALKDQIAIVTGVLSDQQRLICRGKVLKDDQLLSSYHVEDGHTLHLVVREPLPPPSESSPYHPASHASGFGHGPNSQARPSVMVGTFNVSDQADGSFPDLSRIVSAVLGSFGAANVGSGSEGADLREHLRTNGPIGLTDSSSLQPGQAGRRGQTDSINVASSLPNVNPLEHVPLVIPDSLATLSQYLSHMRQEFGFGVGGLGNSSQGADSHVAHGAESNAAASRRTSGLGGLPTPGYLAEVLSSTRQFLIDQAGECLAQLAVQLVEHPTVTDPVARMSIQSNAMRSGDLFQKLGALLFELGRTTMTLRMGQEPVEAVVNAGPAMFISTSGPNPIMVQPVPFLQGTGFGVTPFGTVQPSSGLAGASLRAGFLPRNVDIRIRAGSSAPTVIANQGEPTDVQQPNGQNSASPGFAHPASQAATVTGVSSSSREPEVRVLPIRTVVTAIPSVRRPPSDSSQGPMGMFYPVMARVQQVTNGDLNIAAGSQTSEEGQPSAPMNEGLQSLGSAVRQESSESAEAVPGGDPSQVHGRLDQLLRTLFPGDQVQVGAVRPSVPAAGNTEGMSEGGGVSNEGLFLSNMLHQVMPFISETPGDASSDMADMNRNSRENPDVGTSIHHENDPPTPPDSKRQKRE